MQCFILSAGIFVRCEFALFSCILFLSSRNFEDGERTETTGWARRPANRPTTQAPPSSSLASSSIGSAPRSTPFGSLPERPKYNIKPRDKPFNWNPDEVVLTPRHAAIFGEAKPVDIVAHEREIEEVGLIHL